MKRFFFLIISILFLMSFVSAVKPTQVNTLEGLEIAYPKFEYVPQNNNFTLHTHVFNGTTIITNATTSCFLHLYNQKGKHIFERWLSWDSNNLEFSVYINENNFTQLGEHTYIIGCNGTSGAGFADGNFIITRTGQTPADDNLLIFIYLIFIIIISLLIYTMVINIAKTATIETTVSDVAISWGLYFVMLTLYYLARVYIIDDFILNFAGTFLSITAFTHVILPLISLILTMFIRSTEKRKLISVNEFTGRPFK